MILLPPLCRQMLEYVINFFCDLCRKSSIQARNTWARQLATIGGRLIDNSNREKMDTCQPWAILFFELLMHAHGLKDEGFGNRMIWSIDAGFEKELRDRLRSMRTPSRRNIVTPRKSVTRLNLFNGKRSSTLRKSLFGRPSIIEVPTSNIVLKLGPTFIATQDGKHGDSNDRDVYSKRLRLK